MDGPGELLGAPAPAHGALPGEGREDRLECGCDDLRSRLALLADDSTDVLALRGDDAQQILHGDSLAACEALGCLGGAALRIEGGLDRGPERRLFGGFADGCDVVDADRKPARCREGLHLAVAQASVGAGADEMAGQCLDGGIDFACGKLFGSDFK